MLSEKRWLSDFNDNKRINVISPRVAEKEKKEGVFEERKAKKRNKNEQASKPLASARLIIHDLGNARCAYGLVGLAYLA